MSEEISIAELNKLMMEGHVHPDLLLEREAAQKPDEPVEVLERAVIDAAVEWSKIGGQSASESVAGKRLMSAVDRLKKQ
jgi:hypothetical protein